LKAKYLAVLIRFIYLLTVTIVAEDSSAQISLKDTSNHGPEIEEIIGHYISLDTKDTFDFFYKDKDYKFRLVTVDSQGLVRRYEGRTGYQYATNSDVIIHKKGILSINLRDEKGLRTEDLWVKKGADGVIELSPSFKLYKLKNFRKAK